MKQLINNLDLDICAVTETWLKEGDEIGKVALKPEGYEILSSPLVLVRFHTHWVSFTDQMITHC